MFINILLLLRLDHLNIYRLTKVDYFSARGVDVDKVSRLNGVCFIISVLLIRFSGRCTCSKCLM